MKPVEHEARQALRLPATELDDPHHDACRQQKQGDDAGPPRHVPVGARSARHQRGSTRDPPRATPDAGHRSVSRHQAARQAQSGRATLAPTRRGRSPPCSATLASTHEPAATLTVRQTSAAESPLAGRRCGGAAPVARGPAAHGRARRRQATAGRRVPPGRGSGAAAAWSSATWTSQPPDGRLPGDREIAAEVDQHPASDRVVSAARGAVGGQRLGGRPEVELDAWRKLDDPRPPIELHRRAIRRPTAARTRWAASGCRSAIAAKSRS